MPRSKKHADDNPPSHLSAESKAIWRELVPTRAKNRERRELLTIALEARDRVADARRAVAKEGLTQTTKKTGAIHVHPMLKVERDARAQFLAAWIKLRFDVEESNLLL